MYRVMTWNIRYGLANDGDNRWEQRRESAIDVLRESRPDIVGLQEALRSQIDELLAGLPDYDWIGGGRDDGRDRGEFTPILFRRDRLRLRDWSLFWLSQHPQRSGSIGWDARFPRTCAAARLEDREAGCLLRVCNVHLDHHGQAAREQGAGLVLKWLRQAPDSEATIVMGDFNSGERDAPLQAFLNSPEPPRFVEAFRQVHPDAGEVGTRHDFTGDRSGAKIDHLLVDADRLRVLDAGIDRSCRNGRFPSDHFAVWADVAPALVSPQAGPLSGAGGV